MGSLFCLFFVRMIAYEEKSESFRQFLLLKTQFAGKKEFSVRKRSLIWITKQFLLMLLVMSYLSPGVDRKVGVRGIYLTNIF